MVDKKPEDGETADKKVVDPTEKKPETSKEENKTDA